jgi:hypothetical protein
MLAGPTAPAELSLFNGHDLGGWVAEGVSEINDEGRKRPVWTVNGDAIVCNGKGFGFLRYAQREFDDFVLRLEFRLAPGCNSGIGIRTGRFDPAQSRATRPSFHSYEIQLIDDAGKPPTSHSTGSLYRYVAPKENAIKPAGQWNTIEIECRGPRIKVLLNDREIIEVNQSTIDALRPKPLKGSICLQNHGGNIEFRAIRVRELTHSPE